MAILNPALSSGRYILSVSVTAAGPTSIFRLPCGVNSALVDATFADNRAVVSGGAVYAVSTPAVGSSLAECHPSLCLLSLLVLECRLLCQGCASQALFGSTDCLPKAVPYSP